MSIIDPDAIRSIDPVLRDQLIALERSVLQMGANLKDVTLPDETREAGTTKRFADAGSIVQPILPFKRNVIVLEASRPLLPEESGSIVLLYQLGITATLPPLAAGLWYDFHNFNVTGAGTLAPAVITSAPDTFGGVDTAVNIPYGVQRTIYAVPSIPRWGVWGTAIVLP